MREELIQRRFGDAILGADLLALQITGVNAGDDIGFRHTESLSDLRWRQNVHRRCWRRCHGCWCSTWKRRRRCTASESAFDHFLSHREAHGHLGRSAACIAGLGHALGHLELHVVVEIAHGAHAAALVDGGLDFWRHAGVLEDEARELNAILAGDDGVDQRQERVTEIGVARGEVQNRDFGGSQRVAEDADNARPHGVGELIKTEVIVRAGDFLEEELGFDDPEIEGSEGAHADDAEVGITHHDGVGGPPFVAGEEAGGDVVEVRLERGLEAVFPALQRGEDRDVVRGQRVLAGTEGVPELAEVNELSDLRFANNELGSVLDFLVLIRVAEGKGVA